MKKGVLILILSLLLIYNIFLVSAYTVKQSHPRIFLTDETYSRMMQKVNTNDIHWTRTKEYCDSGNLDFSNISLSGLSCVSAENWGHHIYSLAVCYKATNSSIYRDKIIQGMRIHYSNCGNAMVTNDQGYGCRFSLPNYAIGYDWIYNDINQSVKEEFEPWFVNWTKICAGQTQNIIHGKEVPGNYFAGEQFAVGLMSLTLYGHKPEGEIYLNYSLQNMSDEIFGTQAINGRLQSGFGYESEEYDRLSFRNLLAYMEAIKTGTDINLFQKYYNYLNNTVHNVIHSVPPGADYLAIDGDTGHNQNPLFKSVFYVLLKELNPSIEKNYLKYFIDNTLKTDFYARGLFHDEDYLLFYDDTIQGIDYRPNLQNNLDFFNKGKLMINSRSSWDSNAMFINFFIKGYWWDHLHYDSGNFNIWKNGWQVFEAAGYGLNIPYYTWAHNTMIFKDSGQGDRPKGSAIVNNSLFKQDFTYINFNLENLYNNIKQWGTCRYASRCNLLNSYDRSFFYLKPDTLLVFDRFNLVNNNDSRRWILHFANEPTIEGTYLNSSKGMPYCSGGAGCGTIINWDLSYSLYEDVNKVVLTNNGVNTYLKILYPSKYKMFKVYGDKNKLGGNALLYSSWWVDANFTTGNNFDNVLAVINVKENQPMDSIQPINGKDYSNAENSYGALIGNSQLIIFGKYKNMLETHYIIENDVPLKQTILDVPPSITFIITDKKSNGQQNMMNINSTPEGVLSFNTVGNNFKVERIVQCVDADRDGYNKTSWGCGAGDCNDNNIIINPEATDIECDGIDQNCNGRDYCTSHLNNIEDKIININDENNNNDLPNRYNEDEEENQTICNNTCLTEKFECGAQIICGTEKNCGECPGSISCVEGKCIKEETPPTNQKIVFIIAGALIFAIIITFIFLMIRIKKSK